VIYAAPGAGPAAALVRALRDWAHTDLERWQSRVSLIVAAEPAAGRQWLHDQRGEGRLPTWFADPTAAGWRSLGVSGTLGVVGAAKGTTDWRLDGVLADPQAVEPAVQAWVEASIP
jgi:hypothetical protein